MDGGVTIRTEGRYHSSTLVEFASLSGVSSQRSKHTRCKLALLYFFRCFASPGVVFGQGLVDLRDGPLGACDLPAGPRRRAAGKTRILPGDPVAGGRGRGAGFPAPLTATGWST